MSLKNLPDNLFFCLVDMPQPPQEVLDSIRDTALENYRNGDTNVQFATRPAVTDEQMMRFHRTRNTILEGKLQIRADYKRYLVDDVVVNWFNENITDNYNQIGSQLMNNGQMFCPHTDGEIRKYILNYTVQRGGDDVENVWLVEPGHPVVRPGEPIQFPDTDHLRVIKTTRLPERSWCVLYGKIIHTSRNIETERIQLSVAFSEDQFIELKKKFDIDIKMYG